MHFDEFFSYFNTNNSVGRQVYDRTFVEREDIVKDFYVKDGEEFNYSYVIKLQGYDVHPPVYYLFLHTLCSFMPGVFSYWQGLSLNILFLCISSIFVYLIVYEMTGNSIASFVISLFTAVNPGCISNCMFVRMYALLTLWITLNCYLHIRMAKSDDLENLSLKYILLNGILAYLGFLTHYFYLVFLFFIEISFWLPKLFGIKKYYKSLIKYFLSICLFGILGVVSFPQCLGHVNSGYRGVEVKSNMFDFSDFGSRMSFFGGLINKFVFGNGLYVYLLIAMLLLITSYFLLKKNPKRYDNVSLYIECLLLPVAGYFLVSAKGSLIGEEAMMRYQLPIYGLLVVILSLVVYGCCIVVFEKEKIRKTVLYILAGSFAAVTVLSLIRGNVYYLYPEQADFRQIAENNASKECVYIYNSEDNKYFLWNDVEQLWQYDRIYFVNSDNSELLNEKEICESRDLIVYVSTLNMKEDFDEYANLIFNSDKEISTYTKLYSGVYADCYEFK